MHTQLHQLVADMAATRPQAPALTFKDVTKSYGELWSDVAAFGAGLRERGLERGDRVGIYLDKRIETVVSIFGTSAAGGVFVPVNPVLKAGRSRTSSPTAACACSSPRPSASSSCRTSCATRRSSR